MMKKNYIKPAMEVYDLPENQMILCYSNGGLSQIPAIPGQPDDEKHLA